MRMAIFVPRRGPRERLVDATHRGDCARRRVGTPQVAALTGGRRPARPVWHPSPRRALKLNRIRTIATDGLGAVAGSPRRRRREPPTRPHPSIRFLSRRPSSSGERSRSPGTSKAHQHSSRTVAVAGVSAERGQGQSCLANRAFPGTGEVGALQSSL